MANEIDQNKFNTLISFYDLGPSVMATDGSSMTASLVNLRQEMGNLFQVTPYTKFNGQQESIRMGTHEAQTRYRTDIDATCIVEIQKYAPDYTTIITEQFIVNQIFYVGSDNRYMILDLSYRKDSNGI